MKDALGHGSEARGGEAAHQAKVNKVGRPVQLSEQVLSVIRANPGGFSVTPKGEQPTGGFMVSIPGHTKIVNEKDLAGPSSSKIMADYVAEHSAALQRRGAHVGGWTDPKEGKTYLDISQNIKNRNAAIRSGAKRNQIAIWDVRKSREIGTGGTGK